MTELRTGRVKVGVSACVYGAKVRWNMKGWDYVSYFEREADQFIWYPVCPECMAGLGVPRTPIRIAGVSGAEVLQGNGRVMSRADEDVTEVLKEACRAAVEMLQRSGVRAFIYMEGSPSCGVYRTTLKNRRLGKPPGLFGAMLVEKGFFLIPALDLQSPVKRWDWRRRLQAFLWVTEAQVGDKASLYDFWHTMKFICQELDEPEARKIGNELAQMKHFDPQVFEALRERILEILRKPSTPERIRNRLWKHYVHYKRKTGDTLPDILPPEVARSMSRIAQELMQMERAAVQSRVHFGSVPVLHRSRPEGKSSD